MPERTAEEIRKEIADERLRLGDDLDSLKAELRSLVPFVIAGVVAVVLVTRGKGMRAGLGLIRKLL
jgi:hypothetical protein